MSPMKRGKCREATKGGRPCLRLPQSFHSFAMTASYYTEALPKNFPEGRFAAKCIYSKIKSAGFAFPGDVSLTLNMTICLFIVILNAVKNLPEG